MNGQELIGEEIQFFLSSDTNYDIMHLLKK
jgi:hypothetical protein